tara:strand:- start:233 stop:1000 length:768 start_codon:yes stop_codon:yes gene_type:complete
MNIGKWNKKAKELQSPSAEGRDSTASYGEGEGAGKGVEERDGREGDGREEQDSGVTVISMEKAVNAQAVKKRAKIASTIAADSSSSTSSSPSLSSSPSSSSSTSSAASSTSAASAAPAVCYLCKRKFGSAELLKRLLCSSNFCISIPISILDLSLNLCTRVYSTQAHAHRLLYRLHALLLPLSLSLYIYILARSISSFSFKNSKSPFLLLSDMRISLTYISKIWRNSESKKRKRKNKERQRLSRKPLRRKGREMR